MAIPQEYHPGDKESRIRGNDPGEIASGGFLGFHPFDLGRQGNQPKETESAKHEPRKGGSAARWYGPEYHAQSPLTSPAGTSRTPETARPAYLPWASASPSCGRSR